MKTQVSNERLQELFGRYEDAREFHQEQLDIADLVQEVQEWRAGVRNVTVPIYCDTTRLDVATAKAQAKLEVLEWTRQLDEMGATLEPPSRVWGRQWQCCYDIGDTAYPYDADTPQEAVAAAYTAWCA